jgi:hypothetical protein
VFTVLLTDGEFTGLIRTLRAAYDGNIRIVGLSMDPFFPHQSLLDSYYIVPAPKDPSYIDTLISIVKKEKAEILFPIVTEGLEDLLANEKRIFEETGAIILSSPYSAIRIANDKGLLYSYISEHSPALSGIVPQFVLADTKGQLFDAMRQLEENGRIACIKKRRGENAAGFWIIDNAVDYMSLLFNESPSRFLAKSVLASMLQPLNENDVIPPYMAVEYLPGEEWDCDVLCMNGKAISITTRKNIRMTEGLTAVLEVAPNAELEQYCGQIVSLLNLSCIVCISFKADLHGKFKLLEINPRVMGNILVSALAGNNYVRMAVDLLNGKNVVPSPVKYGIRTALYYDQIQIPNVQTKEETGDKK